MSCVQSISRAASTGGGGNRMKLSDQAGLMIKLATEEADLFLDPSGDTYAAYEGGIRKTWAGEFRSWLTARFRAASGEPPLPKARRMALNAITTPASRGPERLVEQVQPGSVRLDHRGRIIEHRTPRYRVIENSAV